MEDTSEKIKTVSIKEEDIIREVERLGIPKNDFTYSDLDEIVKRNLIFCPKYEEPEIKDIKVNEEQEYIVTYTIKQKTSV